jgi:hypothetical protein
MVEGNWECGITINQAERYMKQKQEAIGVRQQQMLLS